MARREIDVKGCALVRFALHVQPALMLSDNAEDGGQAQARALAGGFSGEKRFKNPAENLRVHSGSRVAERQANELPVALFRIHRHGGAVNGFQRSADGDPAAAGHGVAGVDGQIHDDLFNHAAVGVN